ncbi:HNH endonuclease [Mycobacterium phage Estes]|uniref:HNH endonuclease n=1 Tax=Mycobacterium phage Estes TaxID=2759459 RepID=A0A7G9A2G3_9CAUD|nr:HNH endonuclease [Mycobacterium phage Estes]QNL30802.1 HNH endonuclease [Mycobacterium phage Estes]
MTIWKPVPHMAFADYEASDEGEIFLKEYERQFSTKNKSWTKTYGGKTLQQRIRPTGLSAGKHPVVGVRTSTGGSKEKRVALLVASAFHGLPYDPEDKSDLQQWRLVFIDGDTRNCRPENLEWARAITGDTADFYDQNRRAWEAAKKESAVDFNRRMYGDDFDQEEWDALEAA